MPKLFQPLVLCLRTLAYGLLSFTFLLCAPAFALDKPFDHSTWDQFLKRFVNEDGEVDYRGVKQEPELLEQYLHRLASMDPADFPEWPREEKIAVFLNAYHAAIVSVICRHYPVSSIQAIAGVWDVDTVRLADTPFSLNNIRIRELMGKYHDEKMHAALACGARGCPKLSRDAFTGPRVEGQLFLAARSFVNDMKFTRIVPGEKRIGLSRIYKWYAADFRLDFGVFENDKSLSDEEYAVLSFIAHYLEDAKKIEYLEEGGYKIKYLPFDWSLNEWRRKTENPSG